MARKHRLEFPGAIYHVINRGNYRSWVFKEEGAKGSFEVADKTKSPIRRHRRRRHHRNLEFDKNKVAAAAK